MTVFIGPNNAGKSLALRELATYCKSGRRDGRKIVDSLKVRLPTPDEASSVYKLNRAPLAVNETLPEGHIRVFTDGPGRERRGQTDIDWGNFGRRLVDWRKKQDSGSLNWETDVPNYFFKWYLSLLTVSLDGKARLALMNTQKRGDLLRPPTNHLAALFVNDAARQQLREVVHEAFGVFLTIDPTDADNLRVRLSDRAPIGKAEEQSLDAKARQFHSSAPEICEFSDGVRAFCGLMASLLCFESRIMLIDEPDAFLHPTLGRRLGKEVASLTANRGGNVFAATHSAAFLMGCMESGKAVNVVRLTYESSIPTARLLSSSDVHTLMTDPLLRSTRMLEALFCKGAVITESDSDRALYEEVNSRLERDGDCYVRDSVFLRAHNKQTIYRAARLLRSMGVPAAAVVDIDILKGRDLGNLMKACYVPKATSHGIRQSKAIVLQNLEDTGSGWEREGVCRLSSDTYEAAINLMKQLAEYGIFIVPVGQLENWLPSLGVPASKNKTGWLARVFERMGSDPESSDYVHPEDGDIWDFIRGVSKWIHQADPKGIAS